MDIRTSRAETDFPDTSKIESSSASGVLAPFGSGETPSSSSSSPVRRHQAPRPVRVAESKKASGKDDDSKLTPDQVRELYIRRTHTLKQMSGRQEELKRDTKTLEMERVRMQARLLETAQALKSSEKRLNEVEETLSKAREKVKIQRTVLEDKTSKMSALFAMMQTMGRQPPPMVITHTRDALNMIRSGMVVSTFYADLEKIALSVSEDLKNVEAAEKDAERLEAQYRSELGRNSDLKKQIDVLLAENQEQMEMTQTSLAGLQNAVKINAANLKTLEEMIPKLNEEVSKQSGLGSYEAELAKGDVELSPEKGSLALQSARMKPAIPFARSQGLLPFPAQGKLLVSFGRNDADGMPSKGTHFETRAGAQVVSPCDGWIIYAGPFRSYGQLLIINAGGGYHVVIAGMDHVQATVGQFILAGEPIAVMGGLQPREGGGSPARPTLYVEFRKDKQSIDPAPWWSAGVGKE